MIFQSHTDFFCQKTSADICSSAKNLLSESLDDHCDKVDVYKWDEEIITIPLSHLHAYAHYRVGVEACTRAGCQEAWQEADTQQDGQMLHDDFFFSSAATLLASMIELALKIHLKTVHFLRHA